jgi:hypothetical protein
MHFFVTSGGRSRERASFSISSAFVIGVDHEL